MQRQRQTEKQEDWQKNSDVKTELAEWQRDRQEQRQRDSQVIHGGGAGNKYLQFVNRLVFVLFLNCGLLPVPFYHHWLFGTERGAIDSRPLVLEATTCKTTCCLTKATRSGSDTNLTKLPKSQSNKGSTKTPRSQNNAGLTKVPRSKKNTGSSLWLCLKVTKQHWFDKSSKVTE